MKTQAVGQSDLVSSRLSYGCMRIAGAWNPKDITDAMRASGEEAVVAAYEAGYTLFDHADIYAQGVSEEIFGSVLRKVPGMRDQVIIATKCGIRFDPPHRYDFSKEHILWSCDRSLERLGVETIDIYQLHRPDLLMDPAEVGEAFEILKAQGKVRWFGVSNFLPSFVSALQSGLKDPLIVNQVEIHLGRLACFYDGTLDGCLEHRMTPLSWSPLGGGFLGDGRTVSPEHPRHAELTALLKLMDEMAEGYGCTRSALALAWLLKHPSGIIPIVGSVRPQAIREMVRADEIELSRPDWYRLLVAARGEGLP